MNNTESVNIPVKLFEQLLGYAIRLQYEVDHRGVEADHRLPDVIQEAMDYSGKYDMAQPEGDLKRMEEIAKEMREAAEDVDYTVGIRYLLHAGISNQERRKEWYKELAEEYPPYAKGHGGRPGAIPIGDGKVLTSDGEILPG